MAPAQKDTLRKLQAEAYLSVLRAVAASELDWVRGKKRGDAARTRGRERETQRRFSLPPIAAADGSLRTSRVIVFELLIAL